MKLLFYSIFLMSTLSNFSQKPKFANAKVKDVTVYFNAAEITQNVSTILPRGTTELVINNVANSVNESSIRVGLSPNINILSVQYTNDYVEEYDLDQTNPSTKKLSDSISWVKKEIQKIEIEKTTQTKTLEILDKNQQVYGNNSGLNIQELIKLVEYYKVKRNEISSSLVIFNETISKLNLKLSNLNAKLETNAPTEENFSDGKIILQLMNEVAGKVDLSINYLTTTASWQPFYEIMVANTKEPLQMQYKANVMQETGLDWEQVKLTLSSGKPNQNNKAPSINPWFLSYYTPQKISYEKIKVEDALQGIAAGVAISDGTPGANNNIRIRGMSTLDTNAMPMVVINGIISTQEDMQKLNPDAIKSIDVLKDASAAAMYGSQGYNGVVVVTTKQMSDYTTIVENQLTTTFDISVPYTIKSNGKNHSVALKELKVPASFSYFTIPRVENESFLMANISNFSNFNLLKGDANIILEGTYVGKTILDPSQTSDTLNLSIGRDKKVTIKREKISDKSDTKFLSTKKEQTFTYEITVKNNKNEIVTIDVKEQYPLSTDKDVEVILKQTDSAINETEKGILTWKLNLKPNETKKVRISYQVNSPKNREIQNL